MYDESLVDSNPFIVLLTGIVVRYVGDGVGSFGRRTGTARRHRALRCGTTGALVHDEVHHTQVVLVCVSWTARLF